LRGVPAVVEDKAGICSGFCRVCSWADLRKSRREGRIVRYVTWLTFKSVKVCNCAARPELRLHGEEIHQSAFMDIKARASLLARLAIAGSIFGIVLAVVVAWQGLWLSCAVTSGGAIASAWLATLCYRLAAP
jgi:hypothetical protein